jgi:fucokinase
VPILDTCIITSSDERQASVFRTLLERRVDRGLYPREIDFRVFSDPPGGRAGSGGGTIWALLSLLREEGLDLIARPDLALAQKAFDHLALRRILVIHAGGESRRLPAYVPEGKLFAPVPVPSSSFLPPVVLDVELSLFLKYPWREGELLVTSGDAVVDFNTDPLNLPDAPMCGFATPDSFARGSRHGVFAFDPVTGAVKDYHQKASPGYLAREARIEGTESCALDLGLVSFRGQALQALLSSAAKPLQGGSIAQRVGGGGLTLDLYLELLTACLGSLDRRSYGERLAGRSPAPTEVLDLLFDSFQPCGLAGALVRQTSFIHFGSAAEFPSSCRELRAREILPFYALVHEELVPEVGPTLVRYDCLEADVQAGQGGACAEDCRVIRVSCEGENLLVGLRNLSIRGDVPRGFCIDERRFDENGSAVTVRLVYHKDDTFKRCPRAEDIVFCGQPLPGWLNARGLSLTDVFPDGAGEDLYRAELFPAGASADQLPGYWRVPADKEKWAAWFRGSRRFSIAEGNARTDAAVRDAARADARRIEIARGLGAGSSLTSAPSG